MTTDTATLGSPAAADAGATTDPFGIEPRPLMIRAAKLVVAWSPKAGCSHVAYWTFRHEGLLEAAQAYHDWPHRFRQDVYYQDEGYRAAAAEVLAGGGRGYTLLKVTRNPAKRLVSMFRHACRFPFLYAPARRRLGIDIRETGLSLRDLDALLRGVRLTVPTHADPHVCAQVHPVWHLGFDRVITLNMDRTDLNAGLNAVERDLGLPVTDFAAIPAFTALRETHYAEAAVLPIEGAIEDHRITAEASRAFPKAQLEASPFLAAMTRRHYRIDFPHVAPGDTAGRLVWPARP
jgi:hypothetical protein